MPTPNGRLHLGHISGPFLPMDVLKRRLNRDEGNAKLVSGSDVYESHVLLKVQQNNEDAETVCFKNHEFIQEDLKLMNLSYDIFINPLESAHRIPYKKFIQKEFKNLQESGILVALEEILKVSKKYNDVISGCWIHGECPNCNQPTGNYQCENCYSFYNPEDVKNIHSSREDDLELDTVVAKNFFVKVDQEALLKLLKKSNLSDVQMDKIASFFKTHKGFMRVTSPESWGIPVLDKKVGNIPMMSFPYVSMLFYSIYCAGLIDTENWFSKDSDAIIVNAHGMDNLVPTTVGMIGLSLELTAYKTFDYHIANYFLNLDGSKFSTSRNNAIWVDEIIENEAIESDYVRYYLTQKSPQFEEINITKKELITTAKETQQRFTNVVAWAASKLSEQEQIYKVSETISNTFFNTLDEEQKALSPATFKVAHSIKAIEKWYDLKENISSSDIRFWLSGFSILLYPVLPTLSENIWTTILKNEGKVSLAYFFNQLEKENN